MTETSIQELLPTSTHFQSKENIHFNSLSQREAQSVEQFITSLYSLAEYCKYRRIKDMTIFDCINVRICDRALSEQLQLQITLEKAKKRVRQCEASQEQQVTLNEGVESPSDSSYGLSWFQKRQSNTQ